LSPRPQEKLRRWAFAAVPAFALFELGLHVWQTHSVATHDDWAAAKAEVEKRAKPDDLVAFAPRWVDPIGREELGKDLATVDREAYADVSRFPRAIEVSIRGKHLEDLEGWAASDATRFGQVTVTTNQNPKPIKLLDDLVSHVGRPDMHVYDFDGAAEHECAFGRGAPQTGSLGFGPAVPGARYSCASGSFVGASVLPDLDYRARRCLYAPPSARGTLRIRFDAVSFGHALHGHHAISVEAERNGTGVPVSLSFHSGATNFGRVVHRDGEGWKPFELDTSELAGTTAELVVDIAAPSGDRRQYCFEADTR